MNSASVDNLVYNDVALPPFTAAAAVELIRETTLYFWGLEVVMIGQGGFGDVLIAPDFASNNTIWISYMEAGADNTCGSAVARTTLERGGDSAALSNLEVIWRQISKTSGRGHYSHRMAFTPDGKLLITSDDRQLQDPVQDFSMNLGKLIHINPDGSVPADNPFQDRGELAKSFWTVGPHNLLGIAYDANGNLWQHEMGTRHGDELNLIVKGENYGWPVVSNGDNYSGLQIPTMIRVRNSKRRKPTGCRVSRLPAG